MVAYHEMGKGSHNREEESDKRRVVENTSNLAETIRSFMVDLQSFKKDNARIIKEQENKTEINAILL